MNPQSSPTTATAACSPTKGRCFDFLLSPLSSTSTNNARGALVLGLVLGVSLDKTEVLGRAEGLLGGIDGTGGGLGGLLDVGDDITA